MVEVTGGAPKELLPVGDRPVLAWVLDEAFRAGCHRVVVVSSPKKPDLDRYLTSLNDRRVSVAHQTSCRGLAHAVACAGVQGEPSVVLMADVFMVPGTSLGHLVRALLKGAWAGALVRPVPEADVRRYGIVERTPAGSVSRLLEKPNPEETESRWAVSGRYGIGAEAMDAVHRACLDLADDGPELYLAPILSAGIAAGRPFAAVELGQDLLFDCGSPEGYRSAVSALDGA
ncbi:MAG: NTP transferase domain-containing protein [Fimbriimonadaceae bacterium]|nr:NTP transferase domain-containing protein [Fimbriimonadaceae bacterium]